MTTLANFRRIANPYIQRKQSRLVADSYTRENEYNFSIFNRPTRKLQCGFRNDGNLNYVQMIRAKIAATIDNLE